MKKNTITRQQKLCPATGEVFIPDRDNQVYINTAVQIKNNNNRAKSKRKDLKDLNDKIISNQKKLEELLLYLKKNNWERIHAEFVKFVGVDLNAYSKVTKNATTSGRICWSIDYGIEPTDETMTHYYIHKKQNK
jgi:hypothetical protein